MTSTALTYYNKNLVKLLKKRGWSETLRINGELTKIKTGTIGLNIR